MSAVDWAQLYRGPHAWLPSRTIYLTRLGSQAYGTATAASDVDVKGVCVSPGPEVVDQHEPDLTVYDVRAFVALAAAGTPSALEMLWTQESDRLLVTSAGELLLAARADFLSRRVAAAFVADARQRLARIALRRRWLHSQVEEGERAQYEAWLRSRTAERAAQEAHSGYDTKAGAHVVRVLRSCTEVLENERLQVRRPDAEELRAIRAGAWSYDALRAWAASQEARIEALAARSALPAEPDHARLEALCEAIVRSA